MDFYDQLRMPKPSKHDGNNININPPLPLRPNMNIQCGDDGSKINNCVITGGDLQVDGTSTQGITDSSVENIIIEGFIFEKATKYSVLVDKPGTIVFKDCEWRNFIHSSIVPIMMDYYDSFTPYRELVLSFYDCLFRDNQYFGEEAYSTLIFGNSIQNRLNLTMTTFENNNMIWNTRRAKTRSFLIETLGPACIDRSCFINNLVGASDIAVFGNSLVSSQVYLSNSSGSFCSFASLFENEEQYRSFQPTCIAAVEQQCNFGLAHDMVTTPCESHLTHSTSPSVVMVPSHAPSTVPVETPGISTIIHTISPIYVDIFLDEPPTPSVFNIDKNLPARDKNRLTPTPWTTLVAEKPRHPSDFFKKITVEEPPSLSF